jgi:hypothetical protein
MRSVTLAKAFLRKAERVLHQGECMNVKMILPLLVVSACATVQVPVTHKTNIETNIKSIAKANDSIQRALVRDGFGVKRSDVQMGIIETDYRTFHSSLDLAKPSIRNKINLVISSNQIEMIGAYECSNYQMLGFATNVQQGAYQQCVAVQKQKGQPDEITQLIEAEKIRLANLIKSSIQ